MHYFFLLCWVAAAAAGATLPGEGLFLKGDALQYAGKPAGAIPAFEGCAAASPALRPYAMLRAAAARALTGDTAGAMAGYKALLEKEPVGPWSRLARCRLAALLVTVGDRHGARLLYDHAINLQPLPWFLEETAWSAADNLLADPNTALAALPFLSDIAANSIYIEPRKRAARALVQLPDDKARALGVWALMRSGLMEEAAKALMDAQVVFSGADGQQIPLAVLDVLFSTFPEPTPESPAKLGELVKQNHDHPWMKVWLIQAMRTAAGRKAYAMAELFCNTLSDAYGDRPDGGDALYWLAGHYRSAKQPAQAQAWYKRLLEKYPGHAKAADALTALGDMALDEQRWGDALAAYNELAKKFPQSRGTAEAQLHCADINVHMGDRDAEQRCLAKAAGAGPGVYAAHRALARMSAGGAKTEGARKVPVIPGQSFLEAMAASAQPAAWLADTIKDDEGLARLRFFGEHGLEEGEWEAIECVLRAPTGAGRAAWYGAIADAGYMHTLLQFVRAENFGVEAGKYAAARLRLEYPLAYWPLVSAIARETGVDPFLLLAISRQESTFRAGIVSKAGAAGLMQLMPATAKWLANKKGAVPLDHAEHLAVPEHSLRMGAVYIKQMLDRSDGNLVYALAAYNAGPGNCDKWRKRGAGDMDAFIQAIPFTETKDYVKKVLGNYAGYHSLYRIQ